MNVVLLGPPGAGKGTQANRLQRELGVPHIASGDIFRSLGEQDTPLAKEVRSYMARGHYVPDELTIELVLDRLGQPDAARGFVLDGFPRTTPQATSLDEALSARGQKIDVALYITAPTDVLVERIASRIICPNCGEIYNLTTNPPKNDMICDVCGHQVQRRPDEEPEVVRKRLEVFLKQTEPMIEHYRRAGVL